MITLLLLTPHLMRECACSSLATSVRPPVLKSSEGRLIGVKLDASGPCKSQSLFVCSVYMPTGLDYSGPDSSSAILARKLYAQINKWTHQYPLALVLGDFNETVENRDRMRMSASWSGGSSLIQSPQSASSNASAFSASTFTSGRFISTMKSLGFVDIYRHLHPHNDGFTFQSSVVNNRICKSRLDYLFLKSPSGWLASTCGVYTFPNNQHSLLWSSIRLPTSINSSPPSSSPSLPDFNFSTDDEKDEFVLRIDNMMKQMQRYIVKKSCSRVAADLDEIADSMSKWVYSSARKCFGSSNNKPLRSKTKSIVMKELKELRKMKQDIHNVCFDQSLSVSQANSIEHKLWCKAESCSYVPDLNSINKTSSSLDDMYRIVDRSIVIWRKRVKQLNSKMKSSSSSSSYWERNPNAFIHRILRNNGSAQIASIVDPATDRLATSPQEVKSILLTHYRQVFSTPVDVASSCSSKPPTQRQSRFHEKVEQMYQPLLHINENWYASLMNPVNDAELSTLSRLLKNSAAGIWLLLMKSASTRRAIMWFLNACLSIQRIPSLARSATIVPIWKDDDADKSLKNTRPIALQNCLGKVLPKLLALPPSVHCVYGCASLWSGQEPPGFWEHQAWLRYLQYPVCVLKRVC